MNKRRKDILFENIAAAAFLSVMALLVASASFLLDNVADRRDSSALVKFAGSSSIGNPLLHSDSNFRRLYPITRRGRLLYGSVVALGDRLGQARIAFLFAKDGSLDSAGVIGAIPGDLAFSREGWFSEFLGKGGDFAFPMSKDDLRKADTVSGATESFRLTSNVLERLSRSVRQAASIRDKGED